MYPEKLPENFLEELKKIPKADLHVHLEGTVGTATLAQLAEKNEISLETPVFVAGGREIRAPLPEHIRGPFVSGSFRDFIRLYVKISECICDARDISLIIDNYCQTAALEGVVAAEMYVTPTTLTALNLNSQELFEGLAAAQLLAKQGYGIDIAWIFDIVRNSPAPGSDTLKFAEQARKTGVNVVSIGLAGMESGFPAELFVENFREARSKGLGVLIHAGETEGCQSIYDALRAGPPDRIGHGISAIQDEELLEELKQKNIPIEICIASNVALGIIAADQHPLPDFAQKGVPFVIASDDPGIFGKSLLDNFAMAAHIGVSEEELFKAAARSLKLLTPRGFGGGVV